MPSSDLGFTSHLPPEARMLVIGGSGFIGTNLVAAYRAAGVTVRNLDARPARNPADQELWRPVDIAVAEQVVDAVADFRPTHVFHLGARTDLDGTTLEDYRANTVGVLTVLDALRDSKLDIARVVVASSRMVCEIGYQPQADDDYCPPNAYGASKVETELIVRSKSEVPWVLVRPTSIWGPWFGVPYRDFFLNVARGRYIHPRGRRIEKNFGFVGNTVWQLHCIMTASAETVVGRTMYLADDPPIEVHDLADLISVETGRRRTRTVPLPVLKAIAKAGDQFERAGRKAPLTSFRLTNLLTPMYHDLNLLAEVSGAQPYDVQAGVRITVDWMRSAGLVDDLR